MSFFLKKREYIIITFGLVVAGLIFAMVNFSMNDKLKIDSNNKDTSMRLNVLDKDFTIGQPTAHVKVIFYGDVACVHCKRFIQDYFEKLKKNYIDEGKVLFIYRPVIKHTKTLMGAKVLFCNNQRSEEENTQLFLKMFEENWYLKADYLNALMNIVIENSTITKEEFAKCVSSKEVHEILHKLQINVVDKLEINSTPQVFVNKKLLDNTGELFQAIEKEMSGMRNN